MGMLARPLNRLSWVAVPFMSTTSCKISTEGRGAHPRLGKNKLHELRGIKFFQLSAKSVHFSANFGSSNKHIKNNFKNVIFIVFKWCKICKYHVFSIVISLSPIKRKIIHAFGFKIGFTLFFCNFKVVVIYAFFSVKSVFPKCQCSQKKPCLPPQFLGSFYLKISFTPKSLHIENFF